MTNHDPERDLCEHYSEVWGKRDVTGALACYGDDFTLHYFGENRFAGDHVGLDAAVTTLLAVDAITPRRLVSVDQILTAPGAAAMVVKEELVVDGEPVQIGRVLRFRIAGGRFRECWLHEEDQALIDRAWNSSPAALVN